MTEDETYKILKRIPINVMIQHYHNLNDTVWNRMTDDESNKFFENYGWTESEFRHCWNKHITK